MHSGNAQAAAAWEKSVEMNILVQLSLAGAY